MLKLNFVFTYCGKTEVFFLISSDGNEMLVQAALLHVFLLTYSLPNLFKIYCYWTLKCSK